ncbi:hypothetical protein RB595_007310 [Gaeumannomyces hyphopodioides]
MASLVPTYIPAPNWDIPADSDLVVLGRLIKDPKDPESKIAGSSDVPIPPPKVYEGSKVDWATTVEQLRSNSVGLWAKCLQLVGGGLCLRQLKASAESHRFDELQTTYFRPDDGYYAQALADPGVQAYLEVHRWRKPVYMITGIKTARVARVTTQSTTQRGTEVELKTDATSVGVPLEVGPDLATESTKTKGTWFGGSTDYIFAYRLTRMKPRRKGGATSENKAFVKGAVYCKDGEGTETGLHDKFDIEDEDKLGFEDSPEALEEDNGL